MKNFKKIIHVLVLIIILSACSSNKSKTEFVKESSSVSDLIENINNYEKEQNKEVVQKDEDTRSTNTNKIAIDKKDEAEIEKEARQKETIEKEANRNNLVDENIDTVRLKVFGDIMAHLIQTQYAYNRGGGAYDFSDSFTYIKEYVSDSDISIGNYETTTNPNIAYAGFPRFNTPIEFIYAIKDAGFDVLSTANNHSLDTELEGLYSTIDAMDEVGIDHVGSQKDPSDRILVKNVNGINIAFLAYTYGANGREDLLQVREEVDELNYLNQDLIESDIKKAKSKGADFVVVYPHWGIEYQSGPDQSQVDLGRDMIEWGADLVIGNHPHVVQPYEYVNASDGRVGFIAYALGNLISYQNLENNNDIRTEQSVSYDILLGKDKETGETSIVNIEANPIWVGVKYNDFGQSIQTHIASDFLEGGKYYNEVNENQRNRINQAFDMTTETIEMGI